ncbi:hypothetical protein LCGC14_3007960, partial [marine sediment metagenome]
FGNDGRWGYPEGVMAGHRDIWPRPKDIPFDWKTCTPRSEDAKKSPYYSE